MYDELVKRLRNRRICIQQSGNLDDFPLLKEAADAIEELSATVSKMEKATRWIPVEERLPQEDADVLAYVYWPDYGDTAICYGHWHNGWAHLFNHIEGELIKRFVVTHWMPLPQAPKEET